MAANGDKICHFGERLVSLRTQEGLNKTILFQDAEVDRCLISVDALNRAGNEVVLNRKSPRTITNKGETIPLRRKYGVLILTMWVQIPDDGGAITASKNAEPMELDAVGVNP